MAGRSSPCAGVAVALALLAGCAAPAPATPSGPAPQPAPVSPSMPPSTGSATPSPVTAAPPLSTLRLSPDGVGTLVLGEPIDPALATFDPLGCRTPGNADLYPADDPIWGAWIPAYPPIRTPLGHDAYPFEPHHDEADALLWIAVSSPEIRTAEGVGPGDGRADILAAYPEALVASGIYSTVYALEGPRGRLVFEVADDAEALGVPRDRIWSVRVEPLEWPLQSLSGGDAGGWCAIGV